MTPDERWLDIRGAAQVMGIPETTLRGYVTARRVQHTRLGRHVRFTPDDLAAIAQDGIQPVHAGPPEARTSTTTRTQSRFRARVMNSGREIAA